MKKIAIASVLKPANEVRSFDRIGKTLASTGTYEVHIIGSDDGPLPTPPANLHLYKTHKPRRSIKARILQLISVSSKLTKIQPDLTILTSPDLFVFFFFYNYSNRKKLILDLQEDYILNLKTQQVYTGIQQRILLFLTRLMLGFCKKKSRHILLAEKAFAHSFDNSNHYTILENKLAITTETTSQSRLPTDKKTLLFSGVISKYSGIHTALSIYDKLQNHDRNWQLRIIGKCYDKQLTRFLQKLSKQSDSIQLIGITQFVPHHEIVAAIQSADLGIICHQYNENSKKRIPTKLFEYSCLNLPFLLQEHTTWSRVEHMEKYAHLTNLNDPDPEKIDNFLKNHSRISTRRDILWCSWASEKPKLLTSINRLIEKYQ